MPECKFTTTHWTLVLNARRTDTSRAHVALEQLCRIYWNPLYAYLRRRGYGAHDAEDLTQAFIARLLRKNDLADVQREKGKFRTFLLAAMDHFLSDAWDRGRAQKRGGGNPVISLDAEAAETRYKLEPVDTLTAERIYERRWAQTLLGQVLAHLQREYEADGKLALFEHLRFSLTGERADLPYVQLATQLHMTESAVKVAVHRLRHRYRAALRAEIANTVSDPNDIDDEVRHLFSVFSP